MVACGSWNEGVLSARSLRVVGARAASFSRGTEIGADIDAPPPLGLDATADFDAPSIGAGDRAAEFALGALGERGDFGSEVAGAASAAAGALVAVLVAEVFTLEDLRTEAALAGVFVSEVAAEAFVRGGFAATTLDAAFFDEAFFVVVDAGDDRVAAFVVTAFVVAAFVVAAFVVAAFVATAFLVTAFFEPLAFAAGVAAEVAAGFRAVDLPSVAFAVVDLVAGRALGAFGAMRESG